MEKGGRIIKGKVRQQRYEAGVFRFLPFFEASPVVVIAFDLTCPLTAFVLDTFNGPPDVVSLVFLVDAVVIVAAGTLVVPLLLLSALS